MCAGQAVPNVGKVCSAFKTLETAHQIAKHHIPTDKLLQKVLLHPKRDGQNQVHWC
jgi:hypothetical protein